MCAQKTGFSGTKYFAELPPTQAITVPDGLGDLLQSFVDSVRMLLSELEQVTLAYETNGYNDENASAIRRILHKMKGEAGMLGFKEINELCHQTESAFEGLDRDKRTDMLLEFKDWVSGAVEHVVNNNTAIGPQTQAEDTQSARQEDLKLRCLIVEDDFVSRAVLQEILSEYGSCFVAVNGKEAVDAVRQTLEQGQRYDLICLDIMMPEMDGHEALKAIRQLEKEHGIVGLDCVKVIMTTAQEDSQNVMAAFRTGCEAYVIKPVGKPHLLEEMKKLALLH